VQSLEQSQGHKLGTNQQALDRQADPDEPAKIIALLLSDDASFVTGSIYRGIQTIFILVRMNTLD
jgi:NAD(P)-dependent dehydrogenase (short-subunit alcohol dehydrogenase family)